MSLVFFAWEETERIGGHMKTIFHNRFRDFVRKIITFNQRVFQVEFDFS